MDLDVAPAAAPILQDEVLASTNPYNCSNLPSFYKSPSPSSESSTSSSPTSELFTTAGFTNEASTLFENNDASDAPAISSISSKYDDSSSFLDCGALSSPMNIPSPITEEDLGMSVHEFDIVDGMSEDLDLDMKPCVDELYPSDGCFRVDSGCDNDILLSRLDKFLESDALHNVEGDQSGLASMNDLFPDCSTLLDFSLPDDMSAWSMVDNLQGLNTPSFPIEEEVHAELSSTSKSEEESASQMFTRWLQSNAHWVSLSDLRKVKLRTSTIENVTKRLGGGKKGLMLFLKIVLMWVQSSRQKMVSEKGAAAMSLAALNSSLLPASGFMGTSAMTMEGVVSLDTLGASKSPGVLLGAKPHAAALSSFGCGSSPTTGLRDDWTTSRPQGAHATLVHPNLPSSMRRCHATITNEGACSQHQSSNFYQSINTPWLHQSSNVVHGAGPSSMSPSNLQWPPEGGNGQLEGARNTDVSSIMMSIQQRQCADATPAATTRAARKSRMERQRWSIRHNRKWAAATGQHHRQAAAATASGYAHSSTTSWSQSLGNKLLKSYSSLHSCQQSSKATSRTGHHQSKRREKGLKLLFQKELKQSDVGILGRIVLPKKAAETCLPPLELRDGVNLDVEDMNSTKVWNMRYRFWPNNKSRMYLLENTSDFVKLHDLKEGDYMMMYADCVSNRFVIQGVKGLGIRSSAVPASWSNTEGSSAGDKRRPNPVLSTAPNADDSDDDTLLVELIEESLEDVKDNS